MEYVNNPINFVIIYNYARMLYKNFVASLDKKIHKTKTTANSLLLFLPAPRHPPPPPPPTPLPPHPPLPPLSPPPTLPHILLFPLSPSFSLVFLHSLVALGNLDRLVVSEFSP